MTSPMIGTCRSTVAAVVTIGPITEVLAGRRGWATRSCELKQPGRTVQVQTRCLVADHDRELVGAADRRHGSRRLVDESACRLVELDPAATQRAPDEHVRQRIAVGVRRADIAEDQPGGLFVVARLVGDGRGLVEGFPANPCEQRPRRRGVGECRQATRGGERVEKHVGKAGHDPRHVARRQCDGVRRERRRGPGKLGLRNRGRRCRGRKRHGGCAFWNARNFERLRVVALDRRLRVVGVDCRRVGDRRPLGHSRRVALDALMCAALVRLVGRRGLGGRGRTRRGGERGGTGRGFVVDRFGGWRFRCGGRAGRGPGPGEALAGCSGCVTDSGPDVDPAGAVEPDDGCASDDALESDDEPSGVSATATPCPVATAPHTPSATASAPTRPTCAAATMSRP